MAHITNGTSSHSNGVNGTDQLSSTSAKAWGSPGPAEFDFRSAQSALYQTISNKLTLFIRRCYHHPNGLHAHRDKQLLPARRRLPRRSNHFITRSLHRRPYIPRGRPARSLGDNGQPNIPPYPSGTASALHSCGCEIAHPRLGGGRNRESEWSIGQ